MKVEHIKKYCFGSVKMISKKINKNSYVYNGADLYEVLIMWIYLINKYKSILTVLNFFHGYRKKLYNSPLFDITKNTLILPDNFHNEIINCNTKYTVVHLDIIYDDSEHTNILLFNNHTRVVERFDCNGQDNIFKDLDTYLNNYFLSIDYKFQYTNGIDFSTIPVKIPEVYQGICTLLALFHIELIINEQNLDKWRIYLVEYCPNRFMAKYVYSYLLFRKDFLRNYNDLICNEYDLSYVCYNIIEAFKRDYSIKTRNNRVIDSVDFIESHLIERFRNI